MEAYRTAYVYAPNYLNDKTYRGDIQASNSA